MLPLGGSKILSSITSNFYIFIHFLCIFVTYTCKKARIAISTVSIETKLINLNQKWEDKAPA